MGMVPTNYKCMILMNDEGSAKFVHFMTPGVGINVLRCRYMSNIVKKNYFFKNLLAYSQALIKHTECKVMMSKEGSTKIVNFITPRAGILELGRCQKSLIVKMHYFFFFFFFFFSLRHISDKLTG